MLLFLDDISRQQTQEKIIYSQIQVGNIGGLLLGGIIPALLSGILFLISVSSSVLQINLLLYSIVIGIISFGFFFLLYRKLKTPSKPFLEIDTLYGKIFLKGGEINLEKFIFVQATSIIGWFSSRNHINKNANVVVLHNRQKKISVSEAENFFRWGMPVEEGLSYILLKKTQFGFSTRKIAKDIALCTSVTRL